MHLIVHTPNHMPSANPLYSDVLMLQSIKSSGTASSEWLVVPMYYLAGVGQVFGDHGTDLVKEPEKDDMR